MWLLDKIQSFQLNINQIHMKILGYVYFIMTHYCIKFRLINKKKCLIRRNSCQWSLNFQDARYFWSPTVCQRRWFKNKIFFRNNLFNAGCVANFMFSIAILRGVLCINWLININNLQKRKERYNASYIE